MTYQLRLIVTLLLTWAASHAVAAPKDYQLLPDSSNFVRASVVIASPGNEFYSNLGHTAIRLECPIHDLDYCYSFLTQGNTLGILNFFSGNSIGNINAAPTDIFLEEYIKEGRDVEQWTLNLSLHEQQRLWMLLDKDMVDRESRKFNYVQNNCTSISLRMIAASMTDGDRIHFMWPDVAQNTKNGKCIRYIMRDVPWINLLSRLLVGTEGETEWNNLQRMSPELVKPLLESSTIVNGSSSRPLLTGEHEVLVSDNRIVKTNNYFTPIVVFSVILILVIIISIAEWKLKWHKPAYVMDIILLSTQTILGIFLIYMSFQAGLFGKTWNWMLIVFNPIPLIIWLIWRKRNGWKNIYLCYGVISTMFIIMGNLFLAIFDIDLTLLIAIFAARCWAKYLLLRTATPAK